MKTLAVIQHNSAEYLGMIEDHLEGRGTRFRYFRPFTSDGKLPDRDAFSDGLVLLGGGPWGCSGDNDIPTLAKEVEITRQALSDQCPVLAIGAGAQILALAAGGSVRSAPLRMSVQTAVATRPDALDGLLPPEMPVVTYWRDAPVLPDHATVLAKAEDGEAAIWQLNDHTFGFAAHPGLKVGMVEDLVMEFEDAPDNVHEGLTGLRACQDQIADALVPLMTALVRRCHWM